MDLVDVEERSVTQDELLAGREAFLSSTIREVQSISAIEDREFAETGEVTRKVAAAFRAHVEATLG
jgi:branched-subunit amino acid aminotransferase/4-amino-4-deoxychorismate lyase